MNYVCWCYYCLSSRMSSVEWCPAPATGERMKLVSWWHDRALILSQMWNGKVWIRGGVEVWLRRGLSIQGCMEWAGERMGVWALDGDIQGLSKCPRCNTAKDFYAKVSGSKPVVEDELNYFLGMKSTHHREWGGLSVRQAMVYWESFIVGLEFVLSDLVVGPKRSLILFGYFRKWG